MTDQKTERLISNLLTHYINGTDLELEMRIKDVTREIFDSLFVKLQKSPNYEFHGIEQSINTISDNIFGGKTRFGTAKYIRRQIFEGPKIAKDELAQKIPIERPVYINGYMRYTVNLSREIESQPFTTDMNASVRLKTRASYFYKKSPSSGKWRIDLTAIKSSVLKDIGPSLKTIVKELFVEMNEKNFLDKLNYEHIDSFEIEVEHTGEKSAISPNDIIDAINQLFLLINPDYLKEVAYQEEIWACAQYIVKNRDILRHFRNRYGLKRLLNQAIGLSRNNYAKIYPPSGYFVTEKADGVRCLASIEGNRLRLLTSELTEAESKKTFGRTIAEGEHIGKTLLLFDVMVFDGEDLTEKGFADRLSYLSKAAEQIDSFSANSGVKCRPKEFARLTADTLEKSFRAIYEKKYSYEIDGIIITSPDDNYKFTKSYKWKPIEQNTIDFLVVKAPKSMLGIKPFIPRADHDLYILFVGINYQMQEKLGITLLPQYKQIFPDIAAHILKDAKNGLNSSYYPVQFAPSANPLEYLYYHPKNNTKFGDIDYKILEMRKKFDSRGNPTNWEILRVREDRQMEKNYFGNDYAVAELIYNNYLTPLKFEDLWGLTTGYFAKVANNIYKAPNGMKRYVISNIIRNNMENLKWIVDLGSGRGADLHRYFEANVKQGLFIDADVDALAELVQRKFDIMKSARKQARIFKARNISRGMTVYTMQADLKTNYEELMKRISEFGVESGNVDAVMSNFAIHYFCDTLANLQNIIKLVSSLLKVGGIIVFATMSGAKIFNLLGKNDEWTAKENGVIKYAIKKLYKGDKLANVGQNIAIKLPFTDEMYEEPLCNIEFVIKQFELHGFKIEMNRSFADDLGNLRKDNKNLYGQLTDDDKAYIDLHQYISFRKMKNVLNGDKE